MKCQRCGAELLDTDTFCVKCGQKVGEPDILPVLQPSVRISHKRYLYLKVLLRIFDTS